MKTLLYLVTLFLFALYSTDIQAQQWQTPAIEQYGKVVNYPDAVVQPNPEKEYKLLFHIKNDKEREGVNEKLWKIARFINLMGLQNVPKENIQIVAIISGSATPIALSDKAYQKKTGKINPNMDLLEQLKKYDVKIKVCGQALAERNINPETDLNVYTDLTLSTLIDFPTYQMEGYSIMP